MLEIDRRLETLEEGIPEITASGRERPAAEQIRQEARESIRIAAEGMQRRENKRRKPKPLRKGEKVLTKVVARSSKLDDSWEGPSTVVATPGAEVVVVETPQGRRTTLHRDKVKVYVENSGSEGDSEEVVKETSDAEPADTEQRATRAEEESGQRTDERPRKGRTRRRPKYLEDYEADVSSNEEAL